MKRLDTGTLVSGLTFVVAGRLLRENELAMVGFWLIGQALPKPSDMMASAKGWLSERKLRRRKKVHEPQHADGKRDKPHLRSFGVRRERVDQRTKNRNKQGNDDDNHAT
jgi:hypothetical protein